MVSVTSHPMTTAEVDVFNDINENHADWHYRNRFTSGDVVVALDDAVEMFQFLLFCEAKLDHKTSSDDDRCGFIDAAENAVIPFVAVDGVRLVPQFSCESPDDEEQPNLDKKVISGWDLSYLKFACLYLCVKPEFYRDLTECLCIALPTGIAIWEKWPEKHLLDPTVKLPDVSWTRTAQAPAEVVRVQNNNNPKDVSRQPLHQRPVSPQHQQQQRQPRVTENQPRKPVTPDRKPPVTVKLLETEPKPPITKFAGSLEKIKEDESNFSYTPSEQCVLGKRLFGISEGPKSDSYLFMLPEAATKIYPKNTLDEVVDALRKRRYKLFEGNS